MADEGLVPPFVTLWLLEKAKLVILTQLADQAGIKIVLDPTSEQEQSALVKPNGSGVQMGKA